MKCCIRQTSFTCTCFFFNLIQSTKFLFLGHSDFESNLLSGKEADEYKISCLLTCVFVTPGDFDVSLFANLLAHLFDLTSELLLNVKQNMKMILNILEV